MRALILAAAACNALIPTNNSRPVFAAEETNDGEDLFVQDSAAAAQSDILASQGLPAFGEGSGEGESSEMSSDPEPQYRPRGNCGNVDPNQEVLVDGQRERLPDHFKEGFAKDYVALLGGKVQSSRWEVLPNRLAVFAAQPVRTPPVCKVGVHILSPALVRAYSEGDRTLALWPLLTDGQQTLQEYFADTCRAASCTPAGGGVSYSFSVRPRKVARFFRQLRALFSRLRLLRCRGEEDSGADSTDATLSDEESLQAYRLALADPDTEQRLQQLADSSVLADHMRICVLSSHSPETILKEMKEAGLQTLPNNSAEQQRVYVADPTDRQLVPFGYVGISPPQTAVEMDHNTAFVKVRLGASAVEPSEALAYTYFLQSLLADQGEGSLFRAVLQNTARCHEFLVRIAPDSTYVEFIVRQLGEDFSAQAMRTAIGYLMSWLSFAAQTPLPSRTFERLSAAFSWMFSLSQQAVGEKAMRNVATIAKQMQTVAGAQRLLTTTISPERSMMNHFLQSLDLELPSVITRGFELSDPCQVGQRRKSKKRQWSIIRRVFGESLDDESAKYLVESLQSLGFTLGDAETAHFLRALKNRTADDSPTFVPVANIRRLTSPERALFVPSRGKMQSFAYPPGPVYVPKTDDSTADGSSGGECEISNFSDSELGECDVVDLADGAEDQQIHGDVFYFTDTSADAQNTHVELHFNTQRVDQLEFACLKILERMLPVLHGCVTAKFPVQSVRLDQCPTSAFCGCDPALRTQRFNVRLSYNRVLREKPLLELAHALHTPLTESDRWAFEQARTAWLDDLQALRQRKPAELMCFTQLVGFPYSVDSFEELLRQLDFETFLKAAYNENLGLLRDTTIEACIIGGVEPSRQKSLVSAIRLLRKFPSSSSSAPASQPTSQPASPAETAAASPPPNATQEENFHQSYKLRDMNWMAEQLESKLMLFPCNSKLPHEDADSVARLDSSLHVQFPLFPENENEVLDDNDVNRSIALALFFKQAVSRVFAKKLKGWSEAEALTEGAICHLSWNSTATPSTQNEMANRMNAAFEEACIYPPVYRFNEFVRAEAESMRQECIVGRIARRLESGEALNKRLRKVCEVALTEDDVLHFGMKLLDAPRALFLGCWDSVPSVVPKGYKVLTAEDIKKVSPFSAHGPFHAVRPLSYFPSMRRSAVRLESRPVT